MEEMSLIRLSFFVGTLGIVALWEIIYPRKKLLVKKSLRWSTNLGMVFLNTSLLKLLLPISSIQLALILEINHWGIFHNIEISYALAVVLTVVILDFVIYLQHVMFHAVPLFWRLHRMHHSDLDIDVTTGTRFHTIEIFLSMGIKFMFISLLGAPVLGVLIFEILLNATAMFNHGNIYIPDKIERFIRIFLVTPNMHHIHHSIHVEETNSNFGFNLPWWDFIFGTYKRKQKDPLSKMIIGIDLFRDKKYLSLHWTFIQPFLKGKNKYAINKK